MSEQISSVSKQNLHKISPPILAIDYGEKNIGLAITDSKGIIALPLEILKRKQEDFDERIKEVIDEYNIKTLVLGIPQEFEKSHSENTNRILNFKKDLEKLTKLDIFLYDESYSTSHSYKILREKGENMKKSKKKIDKIAATYFLQELIDWKNKTNEK